MKKIRLIGITIALLCAGASAQYSNVTTRQNYNSSRNVTNVAFRNLSYKGNGSAVYVSGSSTLVYIYNALFETNSSGNGNNTGGAVFVANASRLTMKDVIFTGNRSTNSYGGAIYVDRGYVTLNDVSFDNNSANNANYGGGGGGAIYNTRGTLHLTDVSFYNNTSSDSGGAIYNTGTEPLTLTDVSFYNNTAHSGGAIMAITNTITLNVSAGKTSTISGNRATSGNGIYLFQAHITVNTAAGATMDMQDSIFIYYNIVPSIIMKTGAGVWNLGGSNSLVGATNIYINAGGLFLYTNTIMNISSIRASSNTVLTLNEGSLIKATEYLAEGTVTLSGMVNFNGGRIEAKTITLSHNFDVAVDGSRYAVGDMLIGFTSTSFMSGNMLAAYINSKGGVQVEYDAVRRGIIVVSTTSVAADAVCFVPQNGDAVIEMPQTVGNAYVLPAEPVREGYTFGGWFTGTNGTGTEITTNLTVTAPAPVHVYGHWLEETGEFRWIKILGYLGTSANVTVPPTIAGLPVMEIGASAFALGTDNAAVIKSMTLSSSVTTLGVSSFENSLLTNLVIEGTVAAIPAAAFQGCAGLKSFNLADVSDIGANAFYNSGLASATLTAGMTICSNAFSSTPIKYIIVKCDAPTLTGDLIDSTETVYYLPPDSARWDAFKLKHANTRMLTATINTASLADTVAGFSFDIDSNIAVGDSVKMNIIIETKDLLTDADWTTFATNIPPAPFVDVTAAAFPHRFYRARMDRDSIQ